MKANKPYKTKSMEEASNGWDLAFGVNDEDLFMQALQPVPEHTASELSDEVIDDDLDATHEMKAIAAETPRKFYPEFSLKPGGYDDEGNANYRRTNTHAALGINEEEAFWYQDFPFPPPRIQQKKERIVFKRIVNPEYYLTYDAKIRNSTYNGVRIWSFDDLVTFFCDEDTAREILESAAESVSDLGSEILGAYVFPPDYSSDEGLPCFTIEEDDLLTLISALPGEKANECAEALRESQKREQTRARFIRRHQHNWKKSGEAYRKVRTSLGLSLAKAAEEVGVSATTLGSFERGRPVDKAKLVERSYGNYLKLCFLQRQYGELPEDWVESGLAASCLTAKA